MVVVVRICSVQIVYVRINTVCVVRLVRVFCRDVSMSSDGRPVTAPRPFAGVSDGDFAGAS